MTTRWIAGALALALAGCYAGADEAVSATPRALAGSEMDGALHVAADGSVVLDADAQAAFDWLLAAESELGEQLDAWVFAELGRRLPGRAEAAFAAWRTYVDYRAEAAALLDDPDGEVAGLEPRLRAAVERLGDAPIAASERARIDRAFAVRRALARADRDAAAFEVRGEAYALVDGLREISAARLGGGDVQELRARRFGAAAAERLAALDERRADWEARVAAFREARAALAGTTDAAALAAEFSPAELRRVHALDRLAGR